jgi:hypothetical protein
VRAHVGVCAAPTASSRRAATPARDVKTHPPFAATHGRAHTAAPRGTPALEGTSRVRYNRDAHVQWVSPRLRAQHTEEYEVTHRRFGLLALALGAVLLGATPSGPAGAFLDAWAKVPSYTCDMKVHETKGSDVQDRTYHYAFLKPHFAKIDVTGGPGRGGGAVWKGGDTVTGHRGGFASFVKVTKSIHDPETVDLRGGTIADGSFENMADSIKSAATATNGEETILGTAYDTVTIPYKDDNGATRRVIFLNRTTHLPGRRVTYAGETVVETEDFTNVNTAANLSESDF